MPKTRLRPIGEDDILELPAHVGDHIGKDYRLELHREVVEIHSANRNDDGDPGWRCELVSGPKGSGKTTFATSLALRYFLKGYFVVSNVSLLFGHHLESAVDLYAFSRMLPARCVVVIDELQQLLNKYGMATAKSQSFIGGLAELRKKRISLIGITSQEGEINPSFLYEVDRTYYPRPRRYVRQPQSGEAHYDRWCHLRVDVAGPKPYAYRSGKTVGERMGLSAPTRKPKLKVIKGYSPKQVYQAAALQSSFASLPWGKAAGQSIKAHDMHKALEENAVIEFDDDGLDGAEVVTDGRAAWLETLEQDKPEITRLWTGIRQAGLHLEKETPLPLLLTKLAMGGNAFDPAALEWMLERWIGHRPGGRTVDVAALGRWFQQ